jgi:Periplasmic copper-binding protein (NosD)
VNDAVERNVISGNNRQNNTINGGNANVQIFSATNTRVAGNYIGTNASGTAVPTGQATGGVRGIQIRNSTNTTIGGSTAAERNLISGNQHMGIEFVGGGTTGQTIGNYVGTDVTGNSAIANGTGVSTFFANNQTIGGVNPGEGNLISGNTNDGISFVGNSSTNNRAIDNRIGTNAAGTAAVGNGNGVRIFAGANNNQVGNDGNGVNDAAEGNLISGNNRAGISIQGANNNRIAGNAIGVGANGTTAIGNAQDGVIITDAAANSVTANLITNNGRGVAIVGATSTGNSVLVNSIFGNGTIGIDLGRDGITPNSSPSTANNGQAFPVLISATGNTVTGLLNSTPNTLYRLEFFSSPTTDQGQTFLGTLNVTTDAAGIANFSAPVAAIPAGVQVSATATSLTTGSTSEFSAAPGITLTATGGTPQTTVVNTPFATALQGTVRDSRGNPAGGAAVNFVAPAAGATGALTGTLITNLVGQVNNPTTANTIAGPYTVTATALGAPASANFSLTNRPDLPARLTAVGSTSQTTTVNTAFATPLQVNVRDQFGNVVPGAIVNFELPGSGASAIGNVTATTDTTGNANLTLVANPIAGTYRSIATVNGLVLGFDFTNTPGAPAVIRPTSGNGQTALVTRAFRRPLQVQVTDQFGNLLSGLAITFSPPTTGASGLFTGRSIVTTDVNGLTPALSFTANAIAGRYAIAVSTTGLTVTPFRLNNSPVPNETRIITDLQGELLRSQTPTLLNLSPLLCVQRPVPKRAIDEYRDLPDCPLPSRVDRETRKSMLSPR